MLPLVSRHCTVSNVSPDGKRTSVPTTPAVQNCVDVSDATKRGFSLALKVHGALVLSSKRQPKSFNASATICEVMSNVGGLTPGTPPMGKFGAGPTSHTAALPLPRLWSARICKSGRAVGSFGSLLSRFNPGDFLLVPIFDSTTMKNPTPVGRTYTGLPCASVVNGCST